MIAPPFNSISLQACSLQNPFNSYTGTSVAQLFRCFEVKSIVKYPYARHHADIGVCTKSMAGELAAIPSVLLLTRPGDPSHYADISLDRSHISNLIIDAVRIFTTTGICSFQEKYCSLSLRVNTFTMSSCVPVLISLIRDPKTGVFL